MDQQVVLITGATGGVGPSVVQAFLDAGAKVVGSGRTIDRSKFPHENFEGIAANLASVTDANHLVTEAVQKYQRIDALIHVTGGFGGGQPIHETDDDVWTSMIDVNLRAGVNILRAVIPQMRAQSRGRIVAFGSRAGVEPAANIAAYAASKAAMVSLVKTAAMENRKFGITANVILPGTIDTAANRAGDPNGDHSKWVSPKRLAELAVFLASDAAAEITGASIPVYGAGL